MVLGKKKTKYKVRLNSGRVLGPLDLGRIRKLIKKGKITGDEQARHYPEGEWFPIRQESEIADILVAVLEGRLGKTDSKLAAPSEPTQAAQNETVILSGQSQENVEEQEEIEPTVIDTEPVEATVVEPIPTPIERIPTKSIVLQKESETRVKEISERQKRISSEKTVVFVRKGLEKQVSVGKTRLSGKDLIRITLLAIGLGYFGYEAFFEEKNEGGTALFREIQIQVPSPSEVSDPNQSKDLLDKAIPYYLQDTVTGYQTAAKAFLLAVNLDRSNIKALALLTSCYINLIELSAKDDRYFNTINQLIEMAKAQGIDLLETVVAQAEYFVMMGRYDAAYQVIEQYFKTHQPTPEIAFYVAYAFFEKGDFQSAAKFLNRVTDDQAFSPKVFYLRAMLQERFGQFREALEDYRKAINKNPNHVKSHIKIASLALRNAELKIAKSEIDFVMKQPQNLDPTLLAEALYIRGILRKQEKSFVSALGDLELAVKLDRTKIEYVIELYNARYEAGESSGRLRDEARMYYHMAEGEKFFAKKQYEEAQEQFLSARGMNLKSPLPLIRLGDLFYLNHDYSNALFNYSKAAEIGSKNIEAHSKWIKLLIETYQWDKAREALERFSSFSGGKRKADQLYGDLSFKQGFLADAEVYYRKAIGRDTADPLLFVQYAEALRRQRKYGDALFYFGLARRYDPSNPEAIVGTSQVIADSDSVFRAIEFLQSELQFAGEVKQPLLVGLAKLWMRTSDFDRTQSVINQAMAVKAGFADAYLVQAELHLKRNRNDKRQLEKALDAYKAYSDLKQSDPSGYLERFKIYVDLVDYPKAQEELDRVFARFPAFPNHHYWRGVLYSKQGNRRRAIEEFKKEVDSHPNNIGALVELGKELIQEGYVLDALNQFSVAMRLAPSQGEPKQMAGYANFLLKNYEGAISLYRAAVAADPGNPMIYKRLGQALMTVGQKEEAAQAFRKFLELAPDAPDRAEIQQYL